MVPTWARQLPWDVMSIVAAKENVDILLLAAITQQESSGRRFAARYEPNYSYLFKVDDFARKLGITKETEVTAQKISYSYMQVMGSVCREAGFDRPLFELFDPFLAFTYGSRHVCELLQKYNDIPSAIAAYNAGTPRKVDSGQFVNQLYVSSVLGYLSALRL